MNVNESEFVSNITGETLYVSQSPVNQIEDMSEYAPYEQYVNNAVNLNFYSIGIIIPIGLLGNIFSVCVFLLSPILHRTATGQYLVALAIADSTFLVGQLILWLSTHTTEYYIPSKYKLNFHDYSLAGCMLTYFLRYGGGLWSSWLTIAIALERMLAVAFPLRVGVISTLRRARIVIAVIAIFSFGLSLFSFWHFDLSDTPQCKIYDWEGYNTWNTISVRFGTLVIPGVLIAILTVIIIVLLYRARKKRMSQLTVSTGGAGKHYSNAGLSTETQLTLMLVAVCIAMTALKAPYTIAYYFYSSDNGARPYMALRVTEIFNVTNYAINFILYCLSSSSFREQMRKMVCRGNSTAIDDETQQIRLETLGDSTTRIQHPSSED